MAGLPPADWPQDARTLALIYIIKSFKRKVNRLTRFFTKKPFLSPVELDILTSRPARVTTGAVKVCRRRTNDPAKRLFKGKKLWYNNIQELRRRQAAHARATAF
ncbi:MAG: hypothetical protein LUC35_04250 [Clostridiales bacterium]|nr:hypothetical protein [Clostridiales bacterium]